MDIFVSTVFQFQGNIF